MYMHELFEKSVLVLGECTAVNHAYLEVLNRTSLSKLSFNNNYHYYSFFFNRDFICK